MVSGKYGFMPCMWLCPAPAFSPTALCTPIPLDVFLSPQQQLCPMGHRGLRDRLTNETGKMSSVRITHTLIPGRNNYLAIGITFMNKIICHQYSFIEP